MFWLGPRRPRCWDPIAKHISTPDDAIIATKMVQHLDLKSMRDWPGGLIVGSLSAGLIGLAGSCPWRQRIFPCTRLQCCHHPLRCTHLRLGAPLTLTSCQANCLWVSTDTPGEQVGAAQRITRLVRVQMNHGNHGGHNNTPLSAR